MEKDELSGKVVYRSIPSKGAIIFLDAAKAEMSIVVDDGFCLILTSKNSGIFLDVDLSKYDYDSDLNSERNRKYALSLIEYPEIRREISEIYREGVNCFVERFSFFKSSKLKYKRSCSQGDWWYEWRYEDV